MSRALAQVLGENSVLSSDESGWYFGDGAFNFGEEAVVFFLVNGVNTGEFGEGGKDEVFVLA